MSASPHVVAAAAETFDAAVLGSDRPVVVDFWASWCGPCRRFAPVFASLADDMRDRLAFVSVDVQSEPTLGDRLQIFSIPTLEFYAGGHQVAAQVGAGTLAETRKLLEGWLRTSQPQAVSGAVAAS